MAKSLVSGGPDTVSSLIYQALIQVSTVATATRNKAKGNNNRKLLESGSFPLRWPRTGESTTLLCRRPWMPRSNRA